MCLVHNSFRLIAVLFRPLPMLALHFLVRNVEFRFAGAMGCNLCRLGSIEPFLAQMLLDLLPTGAAGFKVFL